MTAAIISGTITPLTQGFLLCASIIIAIGPQNLFILRQGLRCQHMFAIALFSTLADLILISVGVGGLNTVIATSLLLQTLITVAGVGFLLYYGSRALLRAYDPGSVSDHAIPTANTSFITAIITALSFSFLNPSAYLDTLVIIGSKSLLFQDEQRFIFGLGAVLASSVWFFTLAYGASKLAPLFRSQVTWRALDGISGCIMLGIMLTMVVTALPV